jgi:hypothetical protein
MGSASFIKEACTRGTALHNDASVVLENAAAMSNLITALVQWSSATDDMEKSVPLPTDLPQLFTRAVRSLRAVCAVGGGGRGTWLEGSV